MLEKWLQKIQDKSCFEKKLMDMIGFVALQPLKSHDDINYLVPSVGSKTSIIELAKIFAENFADSFKMVTKKAEEI